MLKKINKLNLLKIIIFILIITLVIIGIKKLVPKSKAEPSGEKVVITYSEGKLPSQIRYGENNTENEKVLFEDVTTSVVKTTSNSLILPGETFSDNITDIKLDKANIVDCETFYFNNYDTDEEKQNALDDGTLWSYSFTGWHIVGTSEYIPANTVFQPGDVITPDILEKYATDGTLQLEAVFGKVYYINNPYENMVYKEENIASNVKYYVLDEENSSNATGADDINIGNNPTKPKATIDGLYSDLRKNLGSTPAVANSNIDAYDAYKTVVMLLGDIDYYKNADTRGGISKYYGYEYNQSVNVSTVVYTSATYKSCQKDKVGTVYNYNYKPNGYYNTLYGNFRFDNVNFLIIKDKIFGNQARGNEFELYYDARYHNAGYKYIELTARFNQKIPSGRSSAIQTFRPSQMDYVVVNSGSFGMQNNYSTAVNTGKTLNWYIGRNASINVLTCGVTSGYESNVTTVYNNYNLTITGGTINTIYGGSSGLNAISVGSRNINIYGDGSGIVKYDPKITKLYGGANAARLYGDITIKIDSCQNIRDVYGGGYNFSATTYGNIDINIANSNILGSLYGGGYNGNCEKTASTYIQYSYNYSTSAIESKEKSISELANGYAADRIEKGGDIFINLTNTSITNNIFGSGFGQTQEIETSANTSAPSGWYMRTEDDLYYPNDWNKPLDGYPSYDVTNGRIFTKGYKRVSWTNMNRSGLTFYIHKTYVYLSLATVENVTMNINGCTIGTSSNGQGNIYGGGSIAKVLNNSDIRINNSTIYGNVYGGGDGKTVPSKPKIYDVVSIDDYIMSTYKISGYDGNGATMVTITNEKPSQGITNFTEYSWSSDKSLLDNVDNPGVDTVNKLVYSPNTEGLGSVNGNTSVTISSGSTIYGNVYGGGNAGIIYGDSTVSINSSNIKGIICGGGNEADVLGNTSITVDGNSVIEESVFGGGYSGSVNGGTHIEIIDGKFSKVFGGGYSGTIGASTEVIVKKGTFESIFGGGDQSDIQGNTVVNVGDENDAGITVTGLVYGGGRGIDENGDGDASDFITVHGSSNVTIQGIKTNVENYGSTKLGAVNKEVNVIFKNYWSGNSTSKYKTMNGIDRATTVSFENSYVLLENKGANNELIGIQSIENLVIPKDSGLKISADGNITGNFTGGGELYLDSLVCLTIEGNITGQTTLVLNPELLEDGSKIIEGGIDKPYLKVGGTTPETIAVVSGEAHKYVILQASKETVQEHNGDKYSYFYIAEDIPIGNAISIVSNSIANKVYKEEITNTNEVYMLDIGAFTSDLYNSYYLINDAYNTNSYTNITRKVKLISNTDNTKVVNLPVGTGICMVVDGEYYYYTVDAENVSEISLSDFKKSDHTSYTELKDITNSELVTKNYNPIKGSTSYAFNESFKFIFSFENTSGIEKDNYYPSMNIYYDEMPFGNVISNKANNIVNVQTRDYNCTLITDRTYYEANDLINLTGILSGKEINENIKLPSSDLYVNITFKDNNGNQINIPNGTQAIINNEHYQVKDGKIPLKLLENIGTSSVNENINIILDMTEVLPQDRLSKDSYTVQLEYLNGTKYQSIAKKVIAIIDVQEKYGVSSNVNPIEGIASDKLQLIEKGTKTERSMRIVFTNSSELQNMKMKLKAVERTGEFIYSETDNSKDKIKVETVEINTTNQSSIEQDINITFSNDINVGTYRILVELYDEYDELRTLDYVNFIVFE
ncbi:MAG: hypothetical protein Q4D02_03240 [Clostridia bacterium]|nr:hypothetical protein [Clostridia bacterium]